MTIFQVSSICTLKLYWPDILPIPTDQLCSIGAESSSTHTPPLSYSTLLYGSNPLHLKYSGGQGFNPGDLQNNNQPSYFGGGSGGQGFYPGGGSGMQGFYPGGGEGREGEGSGGCYNPVAFSAVRQVLSEGSKK